MKIPEIDIAIENCQRHLTTSKSQGSIIELYLTRYLLIFIIAQFENQIFQIIRNRVQCKQGGQKINNYLEFNLKIYYLGIKASRLADSLGMFGEQYKTAFKTKMAQTGNQNAVTAYNKLVINRHDTAHRLGSQISFQELIKSYNEGHAVLDMLDESLK